MATIKQDLLSHYELWKSEGYKKYGVADAEKELALYFEIDEKTNKDKK